MIERRYRTLTLTFTPEPTLDRETLRLSSREDSVLIVSDIHILSRAFTGSPLRRSSAN